MHESTASIEESGAVTVIPYGQQPRVICRQGCVEHDQGVAIVIVCGACDRCQEEGVGRYRLDEPMTLEQIGEAWKAMVFGGEQAGFERVLRGIRRGEIALTVTNDGFSLRPVQR